MTNHDELTSTKSKLAAEICKAIKDNDTKKFLELLEKRDEIALDGIKKEFEAYKQANDSIILEKAGVKQYTSIEKQFAVSLVDQVKTASAVGAGGVSVSIDTMPETFLQRLLNDIKEESALIAACNMTYTGFLITMPLDDTDEDMATFTGMGETMSETKAAIKTINVIQQKLGKILYVPCELADMGASWLLSWLQNKLKFCFVLGMEHAIIYGNGKNQYLGMAMSRKGGTNESGEYSKKVPVKLTRIDTLEYPAIVKKLIKNDKGQPRNVKEVILIVSPESLLSKLIPATVGRNFDGSFTQMAFPFPTKVITTAVMNENEAIIGLNKKYEIFISSGSNKDGKLAQDTSIKFAEHMVGIKIFAYTNASYVNENDFILLDLSELLPYIAEVKLINDAEAANSEG